MYRCSQRRTETLNLQLLIRAIKRQTLRLRRCPVVESILFMCCTSLNTRNASVVVYLMPKDVGLAKVFSIYENWNNAY